MAGKNYIIKPPPEEKGKEPLYRVVYAIDVAAPDEAKAAERAWQIIQDKSSLGPILMIIDSQGKQTHLDLA